MKNLKLLVVLLGLSSLSLSQAATTSANAEISTSVTAFCNITMPDVVIPPFSPNDSTSYVKILSGIGFRTGAEGKLNIVCSKGTPYSVSSNNGINGVDGSANGQLSHTVNSDVKILYRFQTWGASDPNMTRSAYITRNVDFVTGVGEGIDGIEQSIPIRALIGMSNTTDKRAIAGTYTDTVILTINF